MYVAIHISQQDEEGQSHAHSSLPLSVNLFPDELRFELDTLCGPCLMLSDLCMHNWKFLRVWGGKGGRGGLGGELSPN